MIYFGLSVIDVYLESIFKPKVSVLNQVFPQRIETQLVCEVVDNTQPRILL